MPNDKDEILAAIAANHADLVGKVDLIAGGVLRIESEVAALRVDVAAYRVESNARLTAVEAKLS